MKVRRKIVLAVFFAVALFFFCRYFITSRNVQVVKGSTVMEKDDNWNSIIANYVNMKQINLIVDGKKQKTDLFSIFMDDKRNIMISYELLTPLFSCATNRFYNSMLVIEKGGNRGIFTAGSNVLTINGVEEKVNVATTVVEGKIFIPLRIFCNKFGYDYTWNYDTNTVSLINLRSDEKIFPYMYDYRNDGKIGAVKNQDHYGTCWAFASLTGLTTSLLPEKRYDFSVDHMSYHSGYNIDPDSGGQFTMSMAYLAAWKGPVLEKDDPYGDGKSPDGLEPVVHVQEMQIIESKNYNDIKKAVFLYGGVQSSIYMSINDINGNNSLYYNPEKSAYCYIGMEKYNHDIVIIGWDDSYPAKNFTTEPEANGAFICVNSWGEQFGEKGYFYVSYYDSNIGMRNIVYSSVEETNNYDNIYQCDELGWVGQIGYGKENAYFANVYETENEEEIKAVGFYATGEDTEYEIYCIRNYEDINSFNSKMFIDKGVLNHAGYYTIKIDDEIKVEKGKKVAIVVNIKTPTATLPIAIEHITDDASNVVLDDGEGYISSNGKTWERVESKYNCNVCLKMYTNDI